MREAIIAVLIISTIFFGTSTYAQENEVFEYQKAVIQSLGWAKEAHNLLKTPRLDDDWEGVVEDSIFAQNKIRSAATSLNKFANSEDEFIKKSQGILETVYMTIDLDIGQSVKFVEKLLNGEKTGRGSIAVEMANLGLAADESWKNLVSATGAATYCLIDDNRKVGDTTPYLVITKSQRDELIKELKATYGDIVGDGPKAGQYSHEAAASLIYKVLTGQGFKMADE